MSTPTLKLVKNQTPRHPMVIAGAIREHAERLQRLINPSSHSVDRIAELCAELEESLTVQQFEGSLKLREAQAGKLPAATGIRETGKVVEVYRRSNDAHIGVEGVE